MWVHEVGVCVGCVKSNYPLSRRTPSKMATSPVMMSTSPFSQHSREDDCGSHRNSASPDFGSSGSLSEVVAQVSMQQ